MNDFETRVQEIVGDGLHSLGIEILQVNLGLRCNQECSHCHLEASPQRERSDGLARPGKGSGDRPGVEAFAGRPDRRRAGAEPSFPEPCEGPPRRGDSGPGSHQLDRAPRAGVGRPSAFFPGTSGPARGFDALLPGRERAGSAGKRRLPKKHRRHPAPECPGVRTPARICP